MGNDSSLGETCESLAVARSSITYHMSGIPEKGLSGKAEDRSSPRTKRFEIQRGVAAEVYGNGLSDCRCVASTFRNITEQGEAGADTAVVRADSDEFAFMGVEIRNGYANFPFLHQTGFEHRMSRCPVSDGDRRDVVLSRLVIGPHIDGKPDGGMCR